MIISYLKRICLLKNHNMLLNKFLKKFCHFNFSALQEAQDIFGVDYDFDEFDEFGEGSEEESEEDAVIYNKNKITRLFYF